MERYEDITGNTYCDLLVVGKERRNKSFRWLCKCLVCENIVKKTRIDLTTNAGVHHNVYHDENREKKKVKKANKVSKQTTPTLCWSCQNYYNGCSWSSRDPVTDKIMYKPVEGWEATPTVLINGSYNGKKDTARSYLVTYCPLYNEDKKK